MSYCLESEPPPKTNEAVTQPVPSVSANTKNNIENGYSVNHI